MSVPIQWRRIAVEAAAIVGSILLAFAIDAWWDGRVEQAQADLLLDGLTSDFQANQEVAQRYADGIARMHAANAAFLDRLRAATPGDEIVVPFEEVAAAVGAPTYSPTNATLQAAISSGQIELINDAELRRLLARWRMELDDVSEDEILIRQIVVAGVEPLLARQVRLGGVFGPHIPRWFFGAELPYDTEFQLRTTSELEGALAQRLFYTDFVVSGMRSIVAIQQAILDRLEERRAR